MRRSKRWPWLIVPFLVMGLAKDNTGEMHAINLASDLTPPPFQAQDVWAKPYHAPKLPPKKRRHKSRPRPQVHRRVVEHHESLTTRQKLIHAARNLLGIPYVWGGASRSGADCSGFTKLVYATVGIELPHLAAAQITKGVQVSSPLPGDLVYWASPTSHVMIYYGKGLVIGARHSGTVSQIAPMWGSPTFYRLV
jgi:cell wall-associated NlpC family hydrolase